MDSAPKTRGTGTARIVIVGVCGSGKSVLAGALRERGYDAYSVSQEHSAVSRLFLHQSPDIVVYLDASDETVSERKSTGWEPELLARQRRRLKLAREKADVRISTDGLTDDELLQIVLKKI